jgi:hypothetical protein
MLSEHWDVHELTEPWQVCTATVLVLEHTLPQVLAAPHEYAPFRQMTMLGLVQVGGAPEQEAVGPHMYEPGVFAPMPGVHIG